MGKFANKQKGKPESKQAKGAFKSQKQPNPNTNTEGMKDGHTKLVW